VFDGAVVVGVMLVAVGVFENRENGKAFQVAEGEVVDEGSVEETREVVNEVVRRVFEHWW
jgi:hypothetical protein